jgi:hypothetical protein
MCITCDKYTAEMTVGNCLDIFYDLKRDVESGNIVHLLGDCPLGDVDRHIRDETMFIVTQDFRCSCGRKIRWGVCVRGAPMLTVG